MLPTDTNRRLPVSRILCSGPGNTFAKGSPRSFHKYCIFVKNSVYWQHPLLLLVNYVLHMKQRSKSISIAGSVGTYTAWHLHPFLSR